MERMSKIFSAVRALMLFALCLAAAGCRRAKSSDALASVSSLTFGSATELGNFDPFTEMTADARAVNFNIFEGLVKVTTDGDFAPALARSWSVSDDGKKYSFVLRDGVKFHDGKTLTASDVIFSTQKAIDSGFPGFDKITSSFVEGGGVSITLRDADPGFISRMSSPVVEENSEGLALHPVGTGPFKFAEFREQDFLRLEKFEDYWGERASLDSVTVKFLASQASLLLSFKARAIDGFMATADMADQIDEGEANIYTSASNAAQVLALNNSFGPFSDVRVRKAMCLLVDVPRVIETASAGRGVRIGGPVIPNLAKYFDAPLAHAYERDVEGAKKLLREAGYGDGFALEITVPSSYTVHVKSAEAVAGDLADAGISARIRQIDWAAWMESVYMARDYEATVISIDGAEAYPTAFLSRYVSGAPNNFINFRSPFYDEVYARAERAMDEGERIALFKEAQRVLSREAASVWIQDISSIVALSKKFEGHADYPLYVTDFSAIHPANR